MKWFLDLTTRGKLFAGFGLMIVLQVAAIASAYLGISEIRMSQKSLYEEYFATATDLRKTEAYQNRVRAGLMTMMLMTGRSDQETWHQDIKDVSKHLDEIRIYP